jgi:tetratricopeptide (TPR) repeat protein
MPHYRTVLVLAAALLGRTAGAQQSASLDAAVRLYEARQYGPARQAFQAVADADPHNARAFYYLGREAFREGDGGEAADQFEKAVSIEPRNADYHFWLGQAYGREAQHVSKFHAAFLAKKIRHEFEMAVQLDPNGVDGRSGLLSYYLIAPGILGGSVDKAREQAREIAKRNPMKGLLADGAIAEREKDMAGAERSYQAAVAQFPDSVFTYYTLGNMYQRTKQYDKALALYDRLRARMPDERPVRYYTGRALALSGQNLPHAEEELSAYLRLPLADSDPPLSSAHNYLGLTYEKEGRRDLAKREYQSALRLDPNHEGAKQGLDRVN